MRVVAIGGGHGLAKALGALCHLGHAPTAVVTAADDGGSSGRLRRDLGIIPPGDLRRALLALASHRGWADVLAHRFQRGHLEGHALGNLLLVALAEQHDGAFVPALRRAGALLGCRGEVLPSTTALVELHAQVAGQRVDGQARVTRASGSVERVWLEPGDPPACPEAVAAIAAADAVVLGPGSLFTSVIANLLIPAIAEAVRSTPGRLVYVANLWPQPGETAGLDLRAHVEAVLALLGERGLDGVVVHEGPTADVSSEPLCGPLDHPRVSQVIAADVVERDNAGHPLWSHDERRLAHALAELLVPERLPR